MPKPSLLDDDVLLFINMEIVIFETIHDFNSGHKAEDLCNLRPLKSNPIKESNTSFQKKAADDV